MSLKHMGGNFCWYVSRQSKPSLFMVVFAVLFSTVLVGLHYSYEYQIPRLQFPRLAPDVVAEIIPKGCGCKSEKSGVSYNFCYVDPQNSSSIGTKFRCEDLKFLEKLELVDNSGPFVNLASFSEDTPEVVFASATSDNHFTYSRDSIRTFYNLNPNGSFILYSLNLTDSFIDEMKAEFPKLKIRDFDTSPYPEYVTHWTEYRFKPLILAELLRDFPNFWWLDANIHVEYGNLTETLYEEMGRLVAQDGAEKTSPIQSFVDTCHTNFPVLFPELLTYFPTNSIPLLKDRERGLQGGANSVFYTKTRDTVEMFKWWILCALDKTCMNPPGAQIFCKFENGDRFTKFAHCFRFDQSVLNLLLLNKYQDHHKYMRSDAIFLFSRT